MSADAAAALAAWVTGGGGAVDHIRWPVDFDDGGRGVGALAPDPAPADGKLPGKTVLLRVPQELFVTPKVAVTSLAASAPAVARLFAAFGEGGQGGPGAPAPSTMAGGVAGNSSGDGSASGGSGFELGGGDGGGGGGGGSPRATGDPPAQFSDDLAIATFLCLESTRGPASTWWPWLQGLRDPSLRSRLAFWDDAHLALLCDDQLVARVRGDRSQVAALWVAVRNAYEGGAGGGACACPVTLEALLDMVELVRSRTFLNGFALPTVVLVPFADMFNHSDRRDVCTVNWVTRAGKPCVEIRTRRAVPITEQLCISYGDRSSADFLETYNFVPRGYRGPPYIAIDCVNPNEVVRLPDPVLSAEDEWASARRTALATLAVPEDLRAVGVTVGCAASGGLGYGEGGPPTALPSDFADTEMNDVLCLRGEDVEGSVARVLRAFRVVVVPGPALCERGVAVVEEPLVAPLESAAVQAMVEAIDRQLGAHLAYDAADAKGAVPGGDPTLAAMAFTFRANRGALLAQARAVLMHATGSP